MNVLVTLVIQTFTALLTSMNVALSHVPLRDVVLMQSIRILAPVTMATLAPHVRLKLTNVDLIHAYKATALMQSDFTLARVMMALAVPNVILS